MSQRTTKTAGPLQFQMALGNNSVTFTPVADQPGTYDLTFNVTEPSVLSGLDTRHPVAYGEQGGLDVIEGFAEAVRKDATLLPANDGDETYRGSKEISVHDKPPYGEQKQARMRIKLNDPETNITNVIGNAIADTFLDHGSFITITNRNGPGYQMSIGINQETGVISLRHGIRPVPQKDRKPVEDSMAAALQAKGYDVAQADSGDLRQHAFITITPKNDGNEHGMPDYEANRKLLRDATKAYWEACAEHIKAPAVQAKK